MREREHSRGGAEREGDTESEEGSRLWAVSTEPWAQMTWAKVGCLTYWATQAPLAINLTKKAKDLYTENYETMIKESEERDKWKDIPWSWIQRIKIVEMPILSKTIYRFNAILIRIPMALFREKERS